jgi:hypothetical protein
MVLAKRPSLPRCSPIPFRKWYVALAFLLLDFSFLILGHSMWDEGGAGGA